MLAGALVGLRRLLGGCYGHPQRPIARRPCERPHSSDVLALGIPAKRPGFPKGLNGPLGDRLPIASKLPPGCSDHGLLVALLCVSWASPTEMFPLGIRWTTCSAKLFA